MHNKFVHNKSVHNNFTSKCEAANLESESKQMYPIRKVTKNSHVIRGNNRSDEATIVRIQKG